MTKKHILYIINDAYDKWDDKWDYAYKKVRARRLETISPLQRNLDCCAIAL
jgi:hypothetical protein